MAARPFCEFVEASSGCLTIAVHLREGDNEPGTEYMLLLRTRRGRVAARAVSTVAPRVNSVGVLKYTALLFEVETDALPNGAYRLDLSGSGSAASKPIEPSTGLLAASLPESIGYRRYQVFPAAGRPATWLRLSAQSHSARLAWALRNGLRDIAFVLNLRRFSWVRPARLMTRPFVPGGAIWLVGERPETARDNGFALFAHLRRTQPNASVYYVISKSSSMLPKVAEFSNVVEHSSWRHRLLMLHADVLANSYSIKHMLPSRWRPGAYMNQCAWRVGAHRVYLKHGVHLSPDALKRANGGYHFLASVGPNETAALCAGSGYTERQVRETGLARYDNLVPGQQDGTVLLMLTWRRYLVPKLFGDGTGDVTAYAGSAYERFVGGLLESKELAAALDEHDLRLCVVPHYNVAELVAAHETVSDRMTILDAANADIPTLLRSCNLLITDYSSVHFDVAYVGTPVVYAHFDRDEYVSRHGSISWFDVARDGFGPVATDVESTVESVLHYAQKGFVREAEYTERLGGVFAYQDHRNCERIVHAMESLRSPTSFR